MGPCRGGYRFVVDVHLASSGPRGGIVFCHVEDIRCLSAKVKKLVDRSFIRFEELPPSPLIHTWTWTQVEFIPSVSKILTIISFMPSTMCNRGRLGDVACLMLAWKQFVSLRKVSLVNISHQGIANHHHEILCWLLMCAVLCVGSLMIAQNHMSAVRCINPFEDGFRATHHTL